MTKKIIKLHLPPDLPIPSVLDKVDYTTINGQELLFTKLTNGKQPYEKGWVNKGISHWNALTLSSSDKVTVTGFGLNHKLSKTVAFDIDDIEKTKAYFKEEFNDEGETYDGIMENSFRIKSPKPNRDKAIFMLTDEQLKQLEKIEGGLIQHTEEGSVVFEIRGSGGQDVFPPSLYLSKK